AALDRQGRSAHAGRARAGRARRRTEGRSRKHAVAAGGRRQGDPSRAVSRRRLGRRDARVDRAHPHARAGSALRDAACGEQAMTMNRAPRSLLFVPGHRPDRFAKALDAGAEAVVVDLEDAVPPSAKEQARAAVAAWLDSSPLASRTQKTENAPLRLFVRINGADSAWFQDDLS